VHVVATRPVAVPAGAVWLGPRYFGSPARAEIVRFNAGSALRIRYGVLDVWNYDDVVPPAVAAAQGGQGKTIETGRGVGRIYFTSANAVVVDTVVAGKSVAIVSRFAGKVDVVQAFQQLRRKR
jgi:hypothetical protein